jgi:hypothetical protein
MRQNSVPVKEPATQVVKNIRRATRRHFSAEDKIRIWRQQSFGVFGAYSNQRPGERADLQSGRRVNCSP